MANFGVIELGTGGEVVNAIILCVFALIIPCCGCCCGICALHLYISDDDRAKCCDGFPKKSDILQWNKKKITAGRGEGAKQIGIPTPSLHLESFKTCCTHCPTIKDICTIKSDSSLFNACCPKVVFVLAFCLGIIGILLMPYTVAGAKTNMPQTWNDIQLVCIQIFYCVVLFFIVIVIPCSLCYYESYDPERHLYHQCCYGCCCSSCLCCVFTIVFFLTYAAAGVSYHYKFHCGSYVSGYTEATHGYAVVCENDCWHETQSITIWPVSLFVYSIALISGLGYIILLCCGGMGMSSLPLSCICAFLKRPRSIGHDEYEHIKKYLRHTAEALTHAGLGIKEKMDRGIFMDYRYYRLYKKEVRQLETDYKTLKEGHSWADNKVFIGAPIIKYFCLCCCGFIALGISIVWIVHIVLYSLLRSIPFTDWTWSFGFLNIVLTFVDEFLFPAGTIIYAFLVMYLIACILSGFTHAFQHLPFTDVVDVRIYPLLWKDTMMSGMLINVALFLLASVSANQFIADNFSDFATGSAFDQMFGGIVKNLWGWEIFYSFVPIIFVLCAAIGMVFSCVFYIYDFIMTKRDKKQKDIKRLLNKYGKGKKLGILKAGTFH